MDDRTSSRGVSRRVLFGAAGAGVVGTGLGAVLGGGTAQAAVRLGIDYSWGRPRPSRIAEAGYTFVCRYVSWSTTGKNLTRSEADALRAAGLDIVVNWEYSADEALDGYAKGASNAQEAVRQAAACGMPSDRPIYFSVDFDATSGQQAAINSYFDGVASVIGRSRVGAYGGYHVIKRLFDAGKITWGWQTYAWSDGLWDSRAGLRQVQNGITVDGADCDKNEARKVDFGQWGANPIGPVNIYGILDDGRLTYTQVDAATGERVVGANLSTVKLGFTPKAMAALNFNTLVVASTSGELYRVDVVSNKAEVVYGKTRFADSGWAYDHLAYDGSGRLFGIAGGLLRRIDVTVGTHSFRVDNSVVIDTGFALKTLTTTGPDRILGTTAAGKLLWYQINGANDWNQYVLRPATWDVFENLVCAGGGVYLAQRPEGSMFHYVDRNPGDGLGDDISAARPVDTTGWAQKLLSAQPGTVS